MCWRLEPAEIELIIFCHLFLLSLLHRQPPGEVPTHASASLVNGHLLSKLLSWIPGKENVFVLGGKITAKGKPQQPTHTSVSRG